MSQLAKSVEFVELYMNSSLNSTTASGLLTKGQDISNCVPFISWYCGDEYFDAHFPDIWFTNVGTPAINAQRSDYNTNSLYIKAYVVEFDPAKVKVYQGSIPTTINFNSETPVTIGTFNQSRTAMVFYYRVTNVTNFDYLCQFLIRGQVSSNGTDLSFIKEVNVASNHYGHYYAFESINADFTVNHITSSNTAGSYYTLGDYDWHNTFMLHSNCTAVNTSTMSYSTMSSYLWGSTDIVFKKNNTSYTTYYNTQVIQFNNGATTSGIRYCPKVDTLTFPTSSSYLNITLSGCVQATDTLSVVVAHNPSTITTSSAGKSGAFAAVWLTNSGTAYRVERASAAYYESTLSYYFVDWNGQQLQYPNLGTNPNPILPTISPVKSVENISTSFTDYTGAAPVLTKGQVTSNCVVFRSGYSDKITNYNVQSDHEASAYFKGDNLVFERGGTNGIYYIEASVVEFYPDQVKVQQGAFRIGSNATSTTVTLSEAIDVSKTFLVFGCFFPSTEDYWGYHHCRGWIENSTTLGFDRGLAYKYPIIGKWFIAEALTDAWSVLHGSSAYDASMTYTYIANVHASRYKSLTMFSTKSNSTNSSPPYSTWAGSYSSPINPFVASRISSAYNNMLSVQIVLFSNQNVISSRYISFSFTNTDENIFYSLDTTLSGTSLSPIHSNLGMQTSIGASTPSYSTLIFNKISYDSITNRIMVSRNNNQLLAYPYNGGLVAVSWGDSESIGSNIEINNADYFIKSIDRASFTGISNSIAFEFLDGQLLDNCVPLATYSVGEISASEVDRLFYSFWTYPEIKMVCCGVGTAPDDNGVDLALSLLEFDSTQVKVQRGHAHMLSGTSITTVTIEEVDITKAFMIHHNFVDKSIDTDFGPASVAGKINTSTQLHFERGVNTCEVMVSWYVVECLQDQWGVTTYEINNQNITSYEYTLASQVPSDTTISWMSYSNEQNSMAPAYSLFRTYPTYFGPNVAKITAERSSVSSEVERMNFSVITFNDNLGVAVEHVAFQLIGTANSVELPTNRSFDINRTIVWYGQSLPTGKANTNSSNTKRCLFKVVLKNSTTVLITREAVSSVSVDIYGGFYLVEFRLPSHEISGVVKEEGSFVSRQLYFHKTDTGELLGGTTSSATDGAYSFYTTHSGSTYAVCLDDVAGTSYNGLIVTDIYPGQIENAWPNIKGW